MKELARHKLAFEMWYELRKTPPVAEHFGVSSRSVHKWKHEFNWDARCIIRDKEIAEGIKQTIVPEWVEIKAELLSTLLANVREGRKAGVTVQTMRDQVAAVKEIRSIMGESDKIEVLGAIKHEVTADPDVLKTANELAQKLSK